MHRLPSWFRGGRFAARFPGFPWALVSTASFFEKCLATAPKIFVSRLGGVVCFHLPKLLVAKFLGIASVSFYEVSAQLAAAMRAIPLLMMSALIPATSELGARNEKEKIIRTYVLASKYVALLTIALVGFIVLEADSILMWWLGPDSNSR